MTNAYRYICYKQPNDSGLTRGHKLLPLDKAIKLKKELLQANINFNTSQNCEVHESIQLFDCNGSVLSAPLYADFDGEGCEADVIKLDKIIREEFSVLPLWYFSGNRGYHLIIPMTIRHPYVHRINKMFFETLIQSVFLDDIYARRKNLRCDGSVHHKTGLYKTGVTIEEIIEGKARDIAKVQQPDRVQYVRRDPSKLIRFLHTVIHKVNQEVIEERKRYEATEGFVPEKTMPNCIRTLIEMVPDDGMWNEIINTVARWFNASEYEMEYALNVMFSESHWLSDEQHVRKVFRCVFRQQSFFGCSSNRLLQEHCCVLCPFNEEELDFAPM